MTWALIIFLIGLIGFILNRKNVILMLVSIEIMLLSITLIILINSIAFNDNLGQLFALFIIALAGAESAIGLSILVVFYKLTGAISLTNNVNSATSNTIQNNDNSSNY
jgi:NADH-ubiquinone oxidoreductase chain 4L